MRFVFKISLSLLEIGENCRFLDLFLQIFSFSFRTRKQILTFLISLLKIRDMDSIFLFLFSILLFDIQSMPGEKSNKCNQCDYATAYASALRKHLIIHSWKKSNKCNQCDYVSCRESDLRTHLKTHNGENPNKCSQCDYASSRADNLRTHLKCIVEKSQTNATSAIMHPLVQTI